MELYSGVDPALTESEQSEGNYFAHVTIGVTESGKILVLTGYLERLSFPEQAKFILREYNAWSPRLVGIETVAYQEALKQQVIYSNAVPLHAIKGIQRKGGRHADSKYRRISRNAALVEEGRVYLREALPDENGEMDELGERRVHWLIEPLYKQAGQYPRAETGDDGLDALDNAIHLTGRRRWFEEIVQ